MNKSGSYGAGDEARTRYLHLGKVALYRMSYTRRNKRYYNSFSKNVNTFFPFFKNFLGLRLLSANRKCIKVPDIAFIDNVVCQQPKCALTFATQQIHMIIGAIHLNNIPVPQITIFHSADHLAM